MVYEMPSSRVRGIVLAGVHAWGESVLEKVCARPMLPVAGRPLIWHVLQWLSEMGIPDVSICANSDTHAFRSFLGDGQMLNMQLDYYEDIMPRGPAGCVRDAAQHDKADTLVVVDGTIVTGINLRDVLQAHRESGASLTVVCEAASNGEASALEPAGIYVISRDALEYIGPKGYQDIKEVLIPTLYDHGQAAMPYIVPQGSTLRVRDHSSYLSVDGWAAGQIVQGTRLLSDYRRHGRAYVHESSTIASSACLVGAVVIGPGCRIRDRATIVGPVTIGAGCHLGQDVVIRQTSIWSDARIGAGAIIDGSIVGAGSLIEPAIVLRETTAVYVTSNKRAHSNIYWLLDRTAAWMQPPYYNSLHCG